MTEAINQVCNDLRNFAQSLKQEASKQIQTILPKVENVATPATRTHAPAQVSNPERPWIVGGSVALIGGLIGALASNSSWSYILGVGGLVSVGYGLTKKNSQSEPANSQAIPPIYTPKGFEVAEKVIALSKSVENSWKIKVEECKTAVQQAIEKSAAPASTKADLMNLTYITERVSINFDTAVSKLESQPATSYSAILAEFERIVNSEIDKTASAQIAIYNNITDKL